MQNTDIKRDGIYEISNNLSNIDKFRFQKSVLLYHKTMLGNTDLIDKAKAYLRVSIETIQNSKASIALLNLEFELILIKYLALKSI